MQNSELERRFNKAIDERKFTMLENLGFVKNIRLAMIAGAAIGYQIGMDDTQKMINSFFEMEKTCKNVRF